MDVTLGDFEGCWQLTRRIEDRRAGLTGQLTGTAVWRRDGNGLRQEESGMLRYGTGAPMRAERVYLWRAEGGGFAVFFEDGRPFHSWTPASPEARHHCAPDLYDVTYDLSRWPVFTQVWHVTGPRKDAIITSRYARA